MIKERYKERMHIIDANQTVEEVEASTLKEVLEIMNAHGQG